ncbi:hypothetical protein HPB50_009651 [Hyalomma asiaticum]|uniref:Uncharacterized protein n=1 Tax=Hyalomma asiaticum TaxID=266040 RepID=A0ACB7T6X5_HYAAI|nr:hypothetical protein HPB50_009651 [Hyalomma asiaticum]
MWPAAQLILTAGLAQALASNWRSIRSDRLNASLCPDSDDDLCSNGRPDSTRLACKCDYACAKFGDCCVDAPRSPSREPTHAWRCHPSGFFSLRACPARWPPDDAVRRLCEGWEDRDGFDDDYGGDGGEPVVPPLKHYLEDVPAFSSDSERMYWNVFCAACHGDAVRLATWPASLDCDSAPLGGRGPGPVVIFDERSLRQLVAVGNLSYVGNNRFLVTDRNEKHRCMLRVQRSGWKYFSQAHLLRSCASGAEVAPRCRNSSAELVSRCGAYTAYVHDRVSRRNYRNYHCALCDVTQKQRLACGAYADDLEPEGNVVSYQWQIEFRVWRNPEDAPLECPDDRRMRDDLTGACVPVGCAPGLVAGPEGMCVPEDVAPPDPFDKPPPECPVVQLGSKYVALLRNGSLLLNVSRGQVFAPDQFLLVAQVNDQNRTIGWYALACACHRISFMWTPSLLFVARMALGVSILCLAVLLVTRLMELHVRRHKMAACLAASAILSQFTLLLEPHIEPFSRGCAALSVAWHYWNLACVAWIVALAGDAYRALHALRNMRPDGRSIRQLGLFCWFGPVIIVAAALAIDRLQPEWPLRPLYGEPLCLLNDSLGSAVFLGAPIAVMLLTAATLLSLVAPRLCGGPPPQTKPAKAEFRADRVRFFRLAAIVILAVVTWSSPPLAVALGMHQLWYAFFGCLAAQGMVALAAFAPLGRLAARLRGTRSAGVLVASSSVGHLSDPQQVPPLAATTVPVDPVTGPYRKHLPSQATAVAQQQSSPTRRSSCKPNLERRFSTKRPLVIEDELETNGKA